MMEDQESLAEVIAHLDVFERDLVKMASQIKEYRYILFSALQAQSLDSELGDVLD